MPRILIAGLLVVLTTPFAPKPGTWPESPHGAKVERNLRYGPHVRNMLDLYLPEGVGPFPLVIWIHGGAWRDGSKEDGGRGISLLPRGYAVAAINYRLSQHARFPAQIEDCLAAVRFLRTNSKKYNLSPDAFGVWGSSAGGHLAALTGTASDVKEFAGYGHVRDGSSRVQCVVDFFGPTDLTKIQEQSAGHGTFDHDGPKSPEARLIGGPVQQNKEKAARANPITYVTKDDPPFLIMHGGKDTTVPAGQSELLQSALKKVGVKSELVILPEAGHGGKDFDIDANEQIEAFFNRHLKKK